MKTYITFFRDNIPTNTFPIENARWEFDCHGKPVDIEIQASRITLELIAKHCDVGCNLHEHENKALYARLKDFIVWGEG